MMNVHVNDADFQRDMELLNQAAPSMCNRIVKVIGTNLLSKIVLRTPVDTGRARGNWQVEIGATNENEIDGVDPGGSAAISEGVSKILAQPDRVYPPSLHIFNNVPYIQRLEDGHSSQTPPSVMVKGSVEEIKTNFDALMASAFRGNQWFRERRLGR